MRYAESVFVKEEKDKAYRIYVSDAVRLINESTAKYGGGSYLTTRFADILLPQKENAEEKSCEEITADIIKRCGLEVRK